MTKLQASTTYISAATNRFNHAAHISPDSTTVAFGCGRLVALWNIDDQNNNGVYETLPGHEGTVTCVQFLHDTAFFSADDKGVVRSWRKVGSGWEDAWAVQAHQQSISTLTSFSDLLVTGSSDSSVKIWDIQQGEKGHLEQIQTIQLQGRYPLAVAMTTLPQSQATILAISGTDRNVNIWTRSENLFVRSATLPGHEDWVRALAFRSSSSPHGNTENDYLVLASGSQDGSIRLWNIDILVKPQAGSGDHNSSGTSLADALLDAFEASLADPTEGEEGGRQITLKRHVISVKFQDTGVQQYAITFDALLIGHEGGVTSLSWAAEQMNTGARQLPPTLLSTSTDSSLILWSPSDTLFTPSSDAAAAPSLWINRQRFGDVGGQRLGGFVGGIWAHTKRGDEAMAWGWHGGWRRWWTAPANYTGEGDEWHEIGAIGGHNGPVKDIEWSPEGEYFTSVGSDQTTRIHAAIPCASGKVWHELARPQVHGYDLVGAVWLSPWTFASIADEKVVRVFEAPGGFVETVKSLGVHGIIVNNQDRPVAASVPPLGLSNKATSDVQPRPESIRPDRRPFEGELAAITLWPEVEKVFGHGYESIAIASSHSREVLATACRATSPQHAVVRLYSTSNYQPFGSPLEGHTLTVTRIAFSPDDEYVVTVSRDRTWKAFARKDNGYVPVATDKSHARIIWDCSWSSEGDIFATASRDKTVKVWAPIVGSSRWPALATLKFKEAATAVAFCSIDDDRRLLAVGLETGEILIHSGSRSSPNKWELGLSISRRTAHIDQIHKLAWNATERAEIKQLLSCSEDGTLKITIVQVGVD